MFELTDEFLQVDDADITFHGSDDDAVASGTWSIEIVLRDFSADDEYDPDTFRPGTDGPELVGTSIELEFIEFGVDDVAELAGRTFEFPVNPAEGYIDASMYLCGAHNRVDVTRIAFGPLTDDGLGLTIDAAFDFAAEAIGVANRTAVIAALARSVD